MTEQGNYCNTCLDEAIAETPNGVITEVNLAEVTVSSRICVRCGHPYCDDHASPVDQASQCLRCLPLESIELRTEPLKGDDGVTHRGKHLIPTGPHYRTLPKAISELTDEELEKFITDTAATIHATEQIQDYRRIGLSTARLEKADREDAKLRQARALHQALPRTARITVTGQKGKGTAQAAAVDFAAFIKFAKEQLAKKASASAQPKAGATPAAGSGAPAVQRPPVPGEAPAEDRNKEIEKLLEEDK